MMTRGERLKHALKLQRWTIVELARRSTASYETIRNVIANKDVTVSMLERIARALGVSPAWLAFGVDVRKMKRCPALSVTGDPLDPEIIAFVEDVRRSCPDLPIVFTPSSD